MTLMEKKSEPNNLLKRLYLVYGEKAHAHFSNEPGWGARSEVTIPYIPYRRMAIRRKAKLKHRNLFFHMLPTHLRSPAKETRAKACLKKAFGLLFVTIQIHAKRKKGTGLLQ